MRNTKFFTSLVLALSLLLGQAATVLAAPTAQQSTPLSGTVQSITIETDPNTGITTVTIEVAGEGGTPQSVRMSQSSAVNLGLASLNADGNLVINKLALGQPIEIDPAIVIPEQPKDTNPVGHALATFFGDIVDYDTVMAAHEHGVGFGVIAQALWMTKQLGGKADVFKALLQARKTGDYSAFTLEDGTVPQNWGQLRKAILDGKKVHKPAPNQTGGSDQNNGNNSDKNKPGDKDKNKNNGNKGNAKDKNKNK